MKNLPVIKDGPPPSGPGEALYVAAVPHVEGRLCLNCALWVPTQRCVIHDASLEVRGSMVCGYHVLGSPFESDEAAADFEQRMVGRVTPETSGLIEAPPTGTRCGNCAYFAAEGGKGGACLRVAQEITKKGWIPAEVELYGCCAQWSSTVNEWSSADDGGFAWDAEGWDEFAPKR